MNYEQFIGAMYDCTKNRVSENEWMEKQEILKNNGVVAVALSLRKKGEMAAPLIYLEPFYDKYKEGRSVEELAEFLLFQARTAAGVPNWDYTSITDFRKIRDRIVYKLVNAKKNEKLLKEVPNLPMLDFAVVFYLMISENGEESCSVMIRNSHMDLWECPISLLYHYAKKNTPRLCPVSFHPLSDFVEILSDFSEDEEMLYVLTNETGVNGATVLLYPDILKWVHKQLGRNYYLLPSSIHEFLIVPETEEASPLRFKSIVKSVNETEIRQEEYLSDHIYYYNGDIITKM